MSAIGVEERTQQLGRELLAEAARYRPGPAERVQDWLLGLTATNERFRGRLLRYLDVLASVDHDSSGAEAKRLAAEYFGDEFPDLPRGLRWLLRSPATNACPRASWARPRAARPSCSRDASSHRRARKRWPERSGNCATTAASPRSTCSERPCSANVRPRRTSRAISN